MLRSIITVAIATQAVAFSPAAITTSGRASTTDLSASKYTEVRTTIGNLDKDNFSSSLAEVEPFLLKDAGSSIYKKSIRRINTTANLLGLEVPAGYAKEAKATQKKREKQDAYVKAKIAENAEAVEEEAEEAPAAEEEA